MNAPLHTSRRELLKAGGALVVAFSVGPHIDALAQDAATAKSVTLDQVDTFLAIDGKGAVTLYAGKVDLGTGVRTALAQIVAEELDVPLASVTLVMGDTALTPDRPGLPSGRHGLVGMRERTLVFGGSMHAGPRPEGGWEVRAALPLAVVPEPR